MATPTVNSDKPRGEKAKQGGETARRRMLAALRSVIKGDFSVRIESGSLRGLDAELAEAFNDVVSLNAQLLDEVERVSRVVAREVGTEGKLGGQAEVRGVAGTWKDLNRLGEFDGVEFDFTGT